MKFQIGILFSAVWVMAAIQSIAAEFPKSGEAEYDTYYIFEHRATMDIGAGTSAIDEFTGITRNVKGEGPFHNMSVRCLMHWILIGEKFDTAGSCVETDRYGDKIYTTFDVGTHYIIGGTGKYEGITGKASYTVTELHEIAGGRNARVVNHKVTWEIK